MAALTVLAARRSAERLSLPAARGKRAAAIVAVVLAAWLTLTGALALGGFFARVNALPPPFVFGVAPPVVLVIALAAWRKSRAWLKAVPESWAVGFQAFRLPVELVLFALAQRGLVPTAMSYEGRNFDILVGLTAPLVAYFCLVRRGGSRRLAVAWNFMGLALLTNVVTIAVMSGPGPLRRLTDDVPNLVPTLFPFAWLAYFLVPLALLGHIVSLMQLAGQERAVGAPRILDSVPAAAADGAAR
jgi:hypothetical protein